MRTSGILFPDGATIEEKTIKWKQIAEISDKDFGFNTPREKTDEVRFCVRVILLNGKGEICVVKSEKFDYMQIPGGGIEDGENIIDALRRETEEETGFSIKNIEPIGFTLERRDDVRNTHSWGRSISFVFSAECAKEVGTQYTESEKAEEFRPVWIKLGDFIEKQKCGGGKILSYGGYFSNRRDLEIAKYFKALQD